VSAVLLRLFAMIPTASAQPYHRYLQRETRPLGRRYELSLAANPHTSPITNVMMIAWFVDISLFLSDFTPLSDFD